MFIGAVFEWILRLTHYADLIEKALPWTKPIITPAGIWVTMVVGILIFVAGWAERKKETDDESKQRAQKSEDGAPNLVRGRRCLRGRGPTPRMLRINGQIGVNLDPLAG